MEGEDRTAGGGSIIGVRVEDRIAGGGEKDQNAGGGEEDLIAKLRSGFHVGLTFLCPSPYFFSWPSFKILLLEYFSCRFSPPMPTFLQQFLAACSSSYHSCRHPRHIHYIFQVPL